MAAGEVNANKVSDLPTEHAAAVDQDILHAGQVPAVPPTFCATRRLTVS
jgi:hypothetical protein